MPREALRCAWEVSAGIVPGQVDKEHTKQWFLTSAEWDSPAGLRLFVEKSMAAEAHALHLKLDCSQGRTCNWVRSDFIWY